MRYYKQITNGFIVSVGTGFGGEEITRAEFNELLSLVRNKPEPPDGFEYWITESGEYKLVEAPAVEVDDSPTDDDYADIGKILMGVME